MIALLEYEDAKGRRPFGKWFSGLSIEATLRVDIALGHLEAGNFSNVKGVGTGVFEVWIHFGPGYRVYFGKEGETLVLLLTGGVKKSQQKDIVEARS